MEVIDIEVVISNNPQIDPEKLAESRALREKLKAAGLQSSRYQLPIGRSSRIIRVGSPVTDVRPTARRPSKPSK